MARAIVNAERMAVNTQLEINRALNWLIANNPEAVRQLLLDNGYTAYNWTDAQIKTQLLQWFNDGFDISNYFNVRYINDADNSTGGLMANTSPIAKGGDAWMGMLTVLSTVIPDIITIINGGEPGANDQPPPNNPQQQKDYTMYIMIGIAVILFAGIMVVAFKRK